MRVYIQQEKTASYGKQFPSDIMSTAFYGFSQLGSDIFFFEGENIDEIPQTKDAEGHPPIVIAYVEETSRFLSNCGIEVPTPIDIPRELESYVHRSFEYKPLSEFKKETTLPVFVKPHSKFKGFPSGVIRNASSRKELFNTTYDNKPLDQDMIVMTSEVVDMLSEYRCFVKKGELVGIKHYQGDHTIFPKIEIIESAISDFRSAPYAYSLDFAVTRQTYTIGGTFGVKRTTELIEAQDMWSIGPYGLSPDIYVSLLKTRWFEIFKNK